MTAETSLRNPPFSPIAARPWQRARPPHRILAIRLQATGDVVISLPWLRALRETLPGTELDFLTRKECADIPTHVACFDHVMQIGGGRSVKRQLLHAASFLPNLLRRRYEIVLDLQNNRVSRMLRLALRPAAWSAFDRYSPVSAGERTRRTIEAAGFPLTQVRAGVPLRDRAAGLDLLQQTGWDATQPLVILSPAGGFPSRNWPLANWSAFAQEWSTRHAARFAILGLPSLQPRADELRTRMGSTLLDLTGRTTASQALAIVQRATLVVSEDCGLMHMAWTSGIPTLALFGSSPHVWSRPLGSHTHCLHSGDLPCGDCMQYHCRYGDVHCLTRHSASFVVEQAEALLQRCRHAEALISTLE